MSLIDRLGRAALFRLDPERAHGMTIAALKRGLVPPVCPVADPRLQVEAAGLSFPNPVGLAAGFDKNAETPDAMLRMGFGFVECGTVTPRPQQGNARPRVFRLSEFEGTINRLGFNNEGHSAAVGRLRRRVGRPGIVGINIGANKDAADFAADYVAGIDAFWDVASYFTVNISSPNTPGLRDLQASAALRDLLDRVLGRRDELAATTGRHRPVFLKIAPDLTRAQMDAIAGVVAPTSLNGLIVSNTTLSRVEVAGAIHAGEPGGLSGRPLFQRSTVALARMRERVGPAMPIIGVGGIDGPQAAIAKLAAGATLLQLYTAMVFRGPGLASEINRGIITEMERRSCSNVGELTGLETAEWAKRTLPEETS